MNTSGEVADLIVKEGIQITESAAKLTALGAKNLAAIVIALMKDSTQLQGKTNLKQLLKSEKPLCILQIKETDIHKFNSEAKKYGVLFTSVKDKSSDTGLCDVIAKQEDVTKLNYIMEKMGYIVPDISPDKEEVSEKEDSDKAKKSQPREKESQSEKRYTARGDNDKGNNRKPSVRKRIAEIKEMNKNKLKKNTKKAKVVKPERYLR